MTDYTPLDSLKECAAVANFVVPSVIQIVEKLTEAHGPAVSEGSRDYVQVQLNRLQSAIDKGLGGLDAGGDAGTYSDGREVISVIELGDSDSRYTHVWHADPGQNPPQPLPVADIRAADGHLYQVVVLAPGVVTAIRVDED